MSSGRWRTLVSGVVAALVFVLVTGCTGVPSSSAPETVQPIGQGAANALPPGPQRDAPARQIVQDFLVANATDSIKHASARQFLTSAARNKWSDLTATVVAGDQHIGSYDARRHSLTVTGRIVGTLDPRGIYTPTLDGIGHGAAVVSFTFGLITVAGQYRINALRNGLLLTEGQFQGSYHARVLYFYDAAERYLVPDVRWSALDDAIELSDWLLGQLVTGPNTTLQNVVSTDTLPAQAGQISVKIDSSVTTVQIPGSQQLGADVRDRLAAQISVTLHNAVSIDEITITDGNVAVSVPRVRGPRFSETDFRDAEGPTPPLPEVYYLSDGRIHGEDGQALRGPLGNGADLFDSIALSRSVAAGRLSVAGVQGTGAQQRLVMGSQTDGVRPTSVVGQLSRPAWAPGRPEVWIGRGAKVDRVVTNGRTTTVSAVSIPLTAGGGRIVAMRLSPDGSRVAMVIDGANSRPALYVGPIARNGHSVQVESLQPISPEGVVVQDVAWVDSLKLYAIGYLAGSQEAGIFETGVDGSSWNDLGISTLPKPPTTITATTDATAWVSADGNVWEQNGANWVSPLPTGQTPGDKPIYLG